MTYAEMICEKIFQGYWTGYYPSRKGRLSIKKYNDGSICARYSSEELLVKHIDGSLYVNKKVLGQIRNPARSDIQRTISDWARRVKHNANVTAYRMRRKPINGLSGIYGYGLQKFSISMEKEQESFNDYLLMNGGANGGS